MPIIKAAASFPARQSSHNGTRLTGAAGDEPEEMPPLVVDAGVGTPVPTALVADGAVAVAAGEVADPDVARPNRVALGPADEVVVPNVVPVADVVLVAAELVADPVAVAAVPVPPEVVPVPLVVGAVTCAAAGAASTRLSSKARRAGSIMTLTRPLPLPNATGTP